MHNFEIGDTISPNYSILYVDIKNIYDIVLLIVDIDEKKSLYYCLILSTADRNSKHIGSKHHISFAYADTNYQCINSK